MSLFGSTQFIPDYKTSVFIPYVPTVFGTQGMSVTVNTTPGFQPKGTYQFLPGKIILINVDYFVTATSGAIGTSTIGFTLPPYPVLDSFATNAQNGSIITGIASVPSNANAQIAFAQATNSFGSSPPSCITHPGSGGFFQAAGTFSWCGLIQIA